MVLTSVEAVPEIFPSEVPSEACTLKTTDVPLMRPDKTALVKQVASLEVMLPERLAVLVPVFAPCVADPEKLKTRPDRLEVNIAWKFPFNGFTWFAVQLPTSEVPQPEASRE